MTRRRNTHTETDALVSRIFGVDDFDELVSSQIERFQDFAPRQAARIIDGIGAGCTDIGALVAQWRRDDERERPGGRPRRVSLRSMLILLLMHAIAQKPLTIRQMAVTVSMALTSEQFETIGLADDGATTEQWYQSIDSAHKTLLRIVDPYKFPRYRRADPARPDVADRINRHRVLTSAKRKVLDEHWRVEAELNAVRDERLNDLMFEILANTVRASEPILRGFNGDVALDATYTRINGHQTSKDLDLDARSVFIEGGLWTRRGNHGVSEEKSKKKGSANKYKFGLETEIATMTPGPEEYAPSLVLGMTLHRPGAMTQAAKIIFSRIARLGLPAGTLSVPRLQRRQHRRGLPHPHDAARLGVRLRLQV